MHPASEQHIPDGLLAASVLLSEKPRHGVASKNPALNLGINEANSTAAIGLRAGLLLNRVQSRYTGKERDTESGLDYFGARYYASNMGRWMSPDWADKPEAVPYSDLANPQSLNLYGYVKNNPLRQTDPDGHDDDGDPQQTATAPPPTSTVPNPSSAEVDASLARTAADTAAAEGVEGGILAGVGRVLGGAVGIFLYAPTMNEGSNDDCHTCGHAGAQQQHEAPAEPQTASGGAMKGGGRNGQKANADRVQSAKDKISDLKGQRDTLASKANKTPADKKQLQKLDNQIKQQQSRMKPSENHSQKGKGQQ